MKANKIVSGSQKRKLKEGKNKMISKTSENYIHVSKTGEQVIKTIKI